MISANKAALVSVVCSEFFLRQSIWEFRREHRQILHAIFFLALLFVGLQSRIKFSRFSGDPWHGVFSVLTVKLVFLVLPFSLEILFIALRISLKFSTYLASIIFRLFDATPLWLLAAAGPPIFAPLARATGVYLKWWLWGTLWAIGGFAVGAFALLSTLLGFRVLS